MSKKTKITGIVVAVLVFLGLSTWYLARTNIPILEPKGTIALKERNLLFFGLGLSAIIVIPVFVLLFTFVWRYRETNSKSHARYRPDLDHSVLTEALWWLIPSILIAILSVVTWRSSHTLDPYRPIASKTPTMTIQVISMDWKWLFVYPNQHIAAVNLAEFPVNTPIRFEVTSDSVMNSFWIPQLGSQIYSMPGMATKVYLMATSAGSYKGYSANISGKGFAGMMFTAKATSRKTFLEWVQQVHRTPRHLTLAAYNQLNKPSEYNPVSYYSDPVNNLYVKIIDKYMSRPQANVLKNGHSNDVHSKNSNYSSMNSMGTL